MKIFNLIKEEKIDDFFKAIEESRVDINIIDKDSYNLLMISVFKGIREVALFLIEKGINLSYQDKNGQTILHHLAIYYDKEVLNSVIKKGIDINLEDNYGNQALWAAVFNDKGFGTRVEMAKILMVEGANPNHTNNVKKTPLEISKIAGYYSIRKVLES